MDLHKYIRQFPGFPREGIIFHDLSPLLADPAAFAETVKRLAEQIRPWKPEMLAGIEARGFLITAALAHEMGLGMVMIRKRGKLPGKTVSEDYKLEYGTASLEVQVDALSQGCRVAVVDDLIGTGGTFNAAITLVRDLGAHVCGAACIMEMPDLGGRAVLDVELASLILIEGK